jgi:lipid-A-disaccharide synthase
MRYYLVAGEPSGDMYAAKVMEAIKRNDAEASFRIWGGDHMEAVGGTQVSHIRDRSFMGIWEVLKNYRLIRQNFKHFEKDLQANKPDVLLLIDYPGFNLRVAPIAKALGIPVHFYIAPKVWAWNKGRIKKIKAYVDFLYTIFPFEPAFFSKHGVSSDYVGNPLPELIQRFKPDPNTLHYLNSDKPLIALLPGSRKMELENMLPVMSKMPGLFPDYRFVMAGSDAFSEKEIEALQQKFGVEIIRGKTYELLSVARAALVTSGTATLETALWNVPQVVCYKFSPLSYWVVKPLIKIKYISLVNLILDAPLVKELIQFEFTVENLQKELQRILSPDVATKQKEGYAAIQSLLASEETAEKVARLIIQRTQKKGA